jgi:hypothetical protein
MSNQSITQEVKAMAERLKQLFPDGTISLTAYSFMQEIQICYHGTKTYQEATNWFRELGIQVRSKKPETTYTRIRGKSDGVEFVTYPDELPPTCHVEKYKERVPKTQTIETGEFIEIERERIVCGQDGGNVADLQPSNVAELPTAAEVIEAMERK